ncbi:MAG: hypothetical protein LWX56_10740 [Ignavibacteria bacterium]|nr:hypothetical protein [Ignavibacteria bacterium]
MNSKIEKSLHLLESYIYGQKFAGYDPYDILNSSWLPLSGKTPYMAAIAIQFHKRNPINIRPILGIKKGLNPKGLGLLLHAYTNLYTVSGDSRYKSICDELFGEILKIKTPGYAGACWGYNFDWASPGSYIPKYTPSSVVTSFVIQGVYAYYKAFQTDAAAKLITDACKYIMTDIHHFRDETGLCFSYTHLSSDCCYNASLLAAEVLALGTKVDSTLNYTELIGDAVSFVLSRQKTEGVWYYSQKPATGVERKQIDFHQGFVLNSLYHLREFAINKNPDIDKNIKHGLEYYKREQFSPEGYCYYRVPKVYPIDIHNQSQGVITFSELHSYNTEYLPFAGRVLEWTIDNMQGPKGNYYYRKNKNIMNKNSYMRWGQAWMLLAFSTYMLAGSKE